MPASDLKKKTAKGLFWGGIGSGTLLLFTVLFGIVLARLLDQSDYGMVAVLSVFMGIAQTIQDGGFTAGLVNRKEIRHEDYNSVFWFSVGAGLFLYTILFFSAPLIAAFFKDQSLVGLSRVYFLWFLFGSVGTAHYALLIKELKVKERTKIDIASLVISNLIGLALIIKGFGYWGLAIQAVLHSFIGTAMRWYYSSWRPAFSFSITPLKEMLPFSIKVVLTGIVYQINATMLTSLLGRFNTKHEVGDYDQGRKWSTIGSSFVNNIIQGVAQPVLVDANGDISRQRNVFRKMLRFTSFISFPLLLGLAFVAEEFIVILITDKWLASVEIMQLLCVWGAFLPVNTLYTQLIISHGKSNIYLLANIAVGVAQIATLLYIHPLGILSMVKAVLCINFLQLFFLHFYTNKLIQIKLIDVLKDIMPYLSITCLVLGISYFISSPFENIYLKLIVKIISSVLLYIAIMWKLDSIIFKECMGYIFKKKE